MSNTALHNPPRPQALKEEIRNENQDKRKIFNRGGIRTHDLRIRTPPLNQLSFEARLSHDLIKIIISSRTSSRTLKQGDWSGLLKAKPQRQTSEGCRILCRPGSVKILKTRVNNSKLILAAKRLRN